MRVALLILAALTVDPRAEALNDAGKTLYIDQKDYAGAAAKFRAAIAISADPRFYYNLCSALQRLGQLDDALAACDEVGRREPGPELADKAARRAAEIRAARPPATSLPAPASAPAVESNAEELYTERATYGWGLGADIGLVHDVGVGDTSLFAPNGLALRLHGDAILVPRHSIGGEVYLHLSGFPARENLGRRLSILDLGAAGFWHKAIWEQLYFTPAVGVGVSFIGAAASGGTDSYASLGLRVDAGLEWVFGGGMHVLSVVPLALGFYLPALGQIGGVRTDASFYGLDHGGTTWAFTVGYRIRFRSSLFPGINLE